MIPLELLTLFGTSVGKLIDNFFPSPEDKVKAEAMKAQFALAMQDKEFQAMAEQVKVIVAEASSENWLTSNWRPLTMIMFASIIANNYILYPYLSLFWHAAPVLEVPTDLWDLLKLGIGGYVVGRSVEKTVATLSTKDKGN